MENKKWSYKIRTVSPGNDERKEGVFSCSSKLNLRPFGKEGKEIGVGMAFVDDSIIFDVRDLPERSRALFVNGQDQSSTVNSGESRFEERGVKRATIMGETPDKVIHIFLELNDID